MLIWPNFIAYNPLTGDNEEFPAVAYALGLRALIDNEQGWHKSLSNVAVKKCAGDFQRRVLGVAGGRFRR